MPRLRQQGLPLYSQQSVASHLDTPLAQVTSFCKVSDTSSYLHAVTTQGGGALTPEAALPPKGTPSESSFDFTALS